MWLLSESNLLSYFIHSSYDNCTANTHIRAQRFELLGYLECEFTGRSEDACKDARNIAIVILPSALPIVVSDNALNTLCKATNIPGVAQGLPKRVHRKAMSARTQRVLVKELGGAASNVCLSMPKHFIIDSFTISELLSSGEHIDCMDVTMVSVTLQSSALSTGISR